MRVALPLLLTVTALAACASGKTVPLRTPEEAAPALERQVAIEAGEEPKGQKPSRRSTSRVLAHVNGEVVNFRDILLELSPEAMATLEPAERRALEQQELIRRVRDRIILQDAREYAVPVTREEFEKARVARIKELEQNGGTLEAFLAEQGMSRQEYEQRIKDGISSEKYMLARIGRSGDATVRVPPLVDIYVSPGETRAFWDRHPELHSEPAGARVRVYVVRPDRRNPDAIAADSAARAEAEAVRKRLSDGEDGAAVWRELHEGAAQPDPGEGLLEMRRGERSAWIEEFAFGTERGTVSDVLQPGGRGTTFYVLRAEGHDEARQVPYEERQDHIRRQIGGIKWQAARYKIELLLLEKATVRPTSVRRKVRDALVQGLRRLDRLLLESGPALGSK